MATARIVELDDGNTCKLCDNALATYSCPRCNIMYCSLACYRSEKHLTCSESFYKECVEEQLSLESSTDAEKADKMKEILQRIHLIDANGDTEASLVPGDECTCCEECVELTSDDDEEYENLVDRFSKVDLDKQSAEEIWEKLTKDEQQEFLGFLRSGDVSKLVPPWEPWWIYHDDSKIQELDDNTSTKQYIAKCPKHLKIKDFTTLSSKQPADCVRYNLMNILASYVFMVRYFNGEHHDFGREAVSCVVTNSLSLKANENFEDFDTALKSVEQECINCEWIMVDQENIVKMKEDLHHLLKGPNNSDRKYYILSALSDFQCLIKEALKTKPEDVEGFETFARKLPPDQTPQVKLESDEKMKQVSRKVDYFLSYTKDCFNYSS